VASTEARIARAPGRALPDTPSTRSPAFPAQLTGILAVAALRALRRLPLPFARFLLSPGPLLHRLLRRRQRARLRACFAAAPFAGLSEGPYYRRRLDLLLRGLRSHGRPVTEAFPRVRVEGGERYRAALASGRPVALLGLHAGPFELLHRIPEAPEGRPFRILTAPAFAPALTRFMAEGREGPGKRILWVGGTGGRGLEKGLRETAERGGVLALMVDQHPGGADVGRLELWDRIRVPWPERLLAFLHGRGFVLLPLAARLEPGGGAEVRIYEPLPGPEAEHVRAFLETAIGAAPEQWNWSYPKIEPSPGA
jgi:lauroyl/myristoyl acyltransferase